MRKIKALSAFLCALITACFCASCAFAPPVGHNTGNGNSQTSDESSATTDDSSDTESAGDSSDTQTPAPPSEAELSFVVDESNYTKLGEAYASAGELVSFRGDYEGNAVKLVYTAESENSYRFESPFSERTLAKMRDEYGYTHVAFWVAVNGITAGSLPIKGSAEQPYSIMEAAGYTEYPFTAGDNRQWYYISIPIALYNKTLSYALDGSGVQYTHFMTVENAEATGDIAFYVGNAEIVREASVLSVNEFTAKGIWNRDVSSVYISAEDETLMNFSGGYVGGAKKFKASANVNWRVDNYFTLPQLHALKAHYTHVTLWFAFDNLATGKIHLENWNTDKMPKFNDHSTVNGGDKTFVPEDNGVWYSMTVSIEDFITICTAEDGETARDCFYLFRIVNRAEAKEGTLMQFYLGDIFFENLD